jgi:hypothetical protein
MKTPQSSHIQSINYSKRTRNLRVTFKNATNLGVMYVYADVPEQVWLELSDEQSSIGHAFHHLIKKPAYRFIKRTWKLPARDSKGRFITAEAASIARGLAMIDKIQSEQRWAV